MKLWLKTFARNLSAGIGAVWLVFFSCAIGAWAFEKHPVMSAIALGLAVSAVFTTLEVRSR